MNAPAPTAQPSFFARAKKFLVAAVGLAANAAAAGVFDDRMETIVMAIVSVLTALGVYQARNARAPQDR